MGMGAFSWLNCQLKITALLCDVILHSIVLISYGCLSCAEYPVSIALISDVLQLFLNFIFSNFDMVLRNVGLVNVRSYHVENASREYGNISYKRSFHCAFSRHISSKQEVYRMWLTVNSERFQGKRNCEMRSVLWISSLKVMSAKKLAEKTFLLSTYTKVPHFKPKRVNKMLTCMIDAAACSRSPMLQVR